MKSYMEFCERIGQESNQKIKNKPAASVFVFAIYILALITIPAIIYFLTAQFLPILQNIAEYNLLLGIILNLLYYGILVFVGLIASYFIFPIYYYCLYYILAPILAISTVLLIGFLVIRFIIMYFSN